MGLDREMLRFQLVEDGRDVGEEFTAYADWVEEGELLRKLLFDAVSRLGKEPDRVGEFLLEVSSVASGHHVTYVAAAYEEERRA